MRRAMGLVGLLAMISTAALGCSTILLYDVAPYYTRIINHIFTVVALASLISLPVFGVLWIHRRHQVAARREEVRRLVMKLWRNAAARLSVRSALLRALVNNDPYPYA